MRAVAVVMTIGALAIGGCSLLFDGNDLKGKNANGDMSAGGSGGTGGGDDLGAGGGGGAGSGGGGGTAQCTPKTTLHYTVSHPSAAAGYPRYLAVADINGDGKVDLVTSNFTNNTFSVLLGDGNGAFSLSQQTPIATCGTYTDEVVAKDVTGDGKADLIITCFDSSTTMGTINVYVNTSTTATVSFGSAKPVPLANSGHYYFPVVGKFTAGATHVGLALVGNNSIYLFAGGGDGTFNTSIGSILAGMGAQSAAVADLNGDGIDDVVAYNDGDEDLTMALSKAGGGFTSTRLAYSVTDMSPGGQVYFGSTPVLADFDGDGLTDIVIAEKSSDYGGVYKFRNTGTATAPAFAVAPVRADTAPVQLPGSVGVGDFNCDGKLDLVVGTNGCAYESQSCTGGAVVGIMTANGTGYDAPQTTTIEPECDNVVVYDFNNDGYPDVACGGGDTTANSINVLLSGP